MSSKSIGIIYVQCTGIAYDIVGIGIRNNYIMFGNTVWKYSDNNIILF